MTVLTRAERRRRKRALSGTPSCGPRSYIGELPDGSRHVYCRDCNGLRTNTVGEPLDAAFALRLADEQGRTIPVRQLAGDPSLTAGDANGHS